jgi:hypothetical protein
MVEMELLLMALGHNFRKMAAKRTTATKMVLKADKQGSKINFEIEIYKFKPLVKYFQQNFHYKKLVA